MARPTVFTWPASSTNSIALNQTLGGAGSFKINGALATIAEPPFANAVAPYVSFPGISRVVTLSSGGNISATNFTIKGTYKGQPQSETRAGPNGNTVATTALFDTVTSVTTDAAVGTNTSVGTGTTGQTQWWKFNYNSTVYGMTVAVVVANTINYTFQATLDDASIVTPTTFNPIFNMVAQTATTVSPVGILQLANTAVAAYNEPVYVHIPFNYCNILINSGTGSLVATFLQQGVT